MGGEIGEKCRGQAAFQLCKEIKNLTTVFNATKAANGNLENNLNNKH